MKIRKRGKFTWNKFTFLNQIALDAVSLIAPAGPTFPVLLDWRMDYNAIIQIFFLKTVTVAYNLLIFGINIKKNTHTHKKKTKKKNSPPFKKKINRDKPWNAFWELNQ